MLTEQIAVSQEVDQYAPRRMAASAAAKAKRLWPGVIGDVLADEIMAVLDLPLWMQSQTRTQRLIDTILNIAEGQGHPAMRDRLLSSSAKTLVFIPTSVGGRRSRVGHLVVFETGDDSCRQRNGSGPTW
jgi:hypothetical protein